MSLIATRLLPFAPAVIGLIVGGWNMLAFGQEFGIARQPQPRIYQAVVPDDDQEASAKRSQPPRTGSAATTTICTTEPCWEVSAGGENLQRVEIVPSGYAARPCSSLTYFIGLEGSKQPQDLGINTNFGSRFAVNYGRNINELTGLGFQLGTAIHSSANAMQTVEHIEGTTGRFQSFTTLGLFRRSMSGAKWGLGYDFLYQDSYDRATLGQWRARVARDVTERCEFGLQFMVSDRSDDVEFLGMPFHLRTLNQVHGTWRQCWHFGTTTGFWLGMAQSHSGVSLLTADSPPSGRQLVFGSDFHAPLNNFLALYGEANFIMPARTGALDAFIGLELSPRGQAASIRRATSFPVLPLASNTSFAVDARR